MNITKKEADSDLENKLWGEMEGGRGCIKYVTRIYCTIQEYSQYFKVTVNVV